MKARKQSKLEQAKADGNRRDSSDAVLEYQGAGRIYERGRPTKGWHRGKRLTRIEELVIGSYVVNVSNQFKAENLLLIVPNDSPIKTQIAYWRYADNETGNAFGSEAGAIWEWELAGPSNEYFEAVRD